ncbi:MAG: glycosyltransferase [Lachnospiraceae bacterium]|nr:glycosyltransferase [Lachnospiraceae bacterium]
MRKVLMILPAMNVSGGIENLFLNYLRHIDRERYCFDFVVHEMNDISVGHMAEDLGAKVFLMPPFSPRTMKKIGEKYKRILSSGNYDIVHSSMANASFFYLSEAKKAGIRVRIQHSHQDRAADRLSHAVRNIPLLKMGNSQATANAACSENAGRFLFKQKPFFIINNAIDYDKFRFDEEKRREFRNRYSLRNEFVVGTAGRLCPQKNQAHLLRDFQKLKEIKPDAMLLIAGEGELKDSLQLLSAELSVSNNVIFLGPVKEMPSFLSAIDCFVFTSLYEGLPVSGVEAQANGLPCVFSDTITKEADISGNVDFLSLDKPSSFWASVIASGKRQERPSVLSDRFDITVQAKRLMDFYDSLVSSETSI